MVEGLLGMATLMLLAALTIEFAHWQTTRHLAAIALMEAARAGSVDHARPQSMERAFLKAMRARFAHGAASETAMRRRFEHIRTRTGLQAWEIEQLAPDRQAFAHATRYTRHDIAHARGKLVLRHDLASRPALTLHLRLTYRQPALFPMVAQLAATLVSSHSSSGKAWAAGLIVIQLEQKIEMQSDAVLW